MILGTAGPSQGEGPLSDAGAEQIAIPRNGEPAREILDDLDRRYRDALDSFEKETRLFLSRTMADDTVEPAERMAAVERWFADHAGRVGALDRLAGYLDEHAPLPPEPPRPERPVPDQPGARLAAELRGLAASFDRGEIPLDAFDKARAEAIARHPLPQEEGKPVPARSIPAVRETGDPAADYLAHARHLASLPATEAAAVIDNPASPFSRAFRRLETAIENEVPDPDPNEK